MWAVALQKKKTSLIEMPLADRLKACKITLILRMLSVHVRTQLIK